MNIRMIPLHEIKPYANNVKHHPISQLEAIVNSIKQFGFRQPIVVDRQNVIIAGHARYEAAATIGMAEVPCEYADDLTEEQVRAYRILDNEIASQGSVNVKARDEEISKIPDFDFKPFNVVLKRFEVALPKLNANEQIREKCLQCNGTGFLD